MKRNNGLCEEVQHNVMRCPRFAGWLAMAIEKIERDDLHVVAINCAKGRHRSVAAAELLRAHYYIRADVQHLTIR